MKKKVLVFFLIVPWLTARAIPLPERPPSRIFDENSVLDPNIKDDLSRTLTDEYNRSKISVYIVARIETARGSEASLANQFRDFWIDDPIGVIILYSQKTNEFAISLTDEAFRSIMAKQKMEALASRIDELREKDPALGMPRIVELLLGRLREDRQPVVLTLEHPTPVWLILGPLCIVLGLLGWGLFRLYRLLAVRNVFTRGYTLKSPPLQPVLGSSIGGLNTAEAKF